VLKDPVEVGSTLIHELSHCAAGLDQGHKGRFRECARKIGLEGKLTETKAGDALTERLKEVISRIGPYPHAELKYSNAPKKQTCRQLKVVCEKCGCICRMSRQAIDEVGCPTCACGGQMMEEESEADPEADPEGDD